MAALRKEGGGNKEAASERRQVVGGGRGGSSDQTRPDQTRLPFHDGWRMFKEKGGGALDGRGGNE